MVPVRHRNLFACILAAAVLPATPGPLDAQARGIVKRAKKKTEDALDRLPSLEDLINDAPITTSLDDAIYGVPLLDDYNPRRFADMTAQERGAHGEFLLGPGAYAYEAQAYCLKAGTPGPRRGDGQLYAPLRGPAADAVTSIIRNAYRRPQIPQHDIQLLLWAIIARSKFEDLSPHLQQVASKLLAPEQVASLNRVALGAFPETAMRKVIEGAPPGVRRVLEAEAKLRNMFAEGSASYEEIERVAVLVGTEEEEEANDSIPVGRWSLHPDGYFVRYFSTTYTHMRIEVSVPQPFTIERDALGRIIALFDRQGHRFETEYDDTIEPLEVPGDPTIRGYAFRRIRFVHPDPSAEGGVRTAEWRNVGWTFVNVQGAGGPAGAHPDAGANPDAPHGPNAAGSASLRWAARPAPGAGQEGRYQDWKARHRQVKEWKGKLEDFKRRSERRNRAPSEQDVQDITDLKHYESGMEAATGGDLSKKGEWIGEHWERVVKAWEYATCRIAGGCDEGGDGGGGGEDGKKRVDPSKDSSMPANRSSQRGKPDLTPYIVRSG